MLSKTHCNSENPEASEMSTNYYLYSPCKKASQLNKFWIEVYQNNIDVILCIKSDNFQLPPVHPTGDTFDRSTNKCENVDKEHVKIGSKRHKLKNDNKSSVVNSNTYRLIFDDNSIYRTNSMGIVDENDHENEFIAKEVCVVSIDWVWYDTLDRTSVQLPDIAQMRLRIILPLYQILNEISKTCYINLLGRIDTSNMPLFPLHLCVYNRDKYDVIIFSILLAVDMITRLRSAAKDLCGKEIELKTNNIQINILRERNQNAGEIESYESTQWNICSDSIPDGLDTVYSLLYQQEARDIKQPFYDVNSNFNGFLSLDNLKEQYYIDKELLVGDAQAHATAIAQFVQRVSNACLKAYQGCYNIVTCSCQGTVDETIPLVNEIKSLPKVGDKEGYSVLEFFSGIGGMRLSLPETIDKVPITSVTAYDISSVANEVYRHNFHRDESHKLDEKGGMLCPKLIDGLKILDVDNKAHIWTMSPPCQPYTTTKGALQLDHNDNRSKGLYHLMYLLRHMQYKPNWIVLENVASFQPSEGCLAWKKCLIECGYSFKECLLSPHSCGLEIPNSRLRYYMLIQHNSTIANVSDSSKLDSYSCIFDEECMKILPSHIIDYYKSTLQAQNESVASSRDMDGGIESHTGSQILADPRKIGYYVNEYSPDVLKTLHIPLDIMQSNWLPRIVSIASAYDTISHCFTKSYGSRRNKFDKSCGSCYFMHGDGPMRTVTNGIHHNDNSSILERLGRISGTSSSNNSNGKSDSNDDQTLEPYYGRIRLFHPREMLKLSGFPQEFEFPETISMNKQYSCIGNSISVSVVRCIMMYLFEKK